MNKEQMEIQQLFLKQEKQVINDLKKMYAESLKQVNEKIENLMGRSDADELNVIYQIDYQKNLKDQIESIMLQLKSNQFNTISDYLKNSYDDGFIGTMYDMQNQGVPLIFPIDQKAVVNAIVNKSKLTDPLYERLGYDIKKLQKDIANEISRGLSTGLSYNDMARNIEYRANVTRNKAALIARTEAHRIQCQATSDAQFKAKEKGADVVKQWDAFLDGRTRKTHRELDGQIKELEEPFEYGRYEAMFPGEFGNPALDCNCRCALLQRARWALGNDFTKWDQENGIVEIKADGYDDFKMKYAKESERVRIGSQKINNQDTLENIGKSSKIKSNNISNISTDEKRNETPLTKEQVKEVKKAARMQGYDGEVIYTEFSNTAFHGSVEGQRFHYLVIGTDAYPNSNGISANSRISVNGCMAHEIVGHYEAWLKGTTKDIDVLEEAQASIRASKFGVGLTHEERQTLFDDAMERLEKEGISFDDVKDSLDIWER